MANRNKKLSPNGEAPSAPQSSGLGQPPKLEISDALLDTIRGLGAMWATHDEVAAWLNVSRSKWFDFKRKHPEAQEMYERGFNQGKVSLRRKQLALAEKNAAMAIFLGKNHLGQTDRHDIGFQGQMHHTHDGETSVNEKMTEEEAAAAYEASLAARTIN